MLILLIFIVLCFIFSNKKEKNNSINRLKNAPNEKDFNNYYTYKSALAEFNDEHYNEFLKECEKGKCTFIEKEIISQEREKSNEMLNELKTKL